jgi:tRNA-splicing ligase RtcB
VEDVCREGSRWAKRKGFASVQDLRRTEEGGSIRGADPRNLSPRALKRGRNQVGSLGAGNHFIEIDLVAEIFDRQAAQVMGLREGDIALQIHCGSRGLGHQVCTDYVKSLQQAVHRYGIELPDRSLVCAPMDSPEGEAYLSAMSCAANYAFANRQVLSHYAREAFESVLVGKVKDWHLYQIYDVAHNIGKIETHQIGGKSIQVCVHRKGATRAFGPGAEDLPSEYKKIGQPVLVPGSMGTSSWVLRGTKEAMQRSLGSSCHGAGRLMSRTKARKTIWGEDLRKQLKNDGIIIRAGSMSGLAEEAPAAYKDVDAVVDTVIGAGIAAKVARLKPLVVIKG